MNLMNLPDEILMIILSHLDTKSLYNLHTAFDRIRNIIRTYNIIKSCNLSLSVMAKARTLTSSFFLDISRNLKELNVCGIGDLNKTGLLRAAKKLQCLNTLDVTYTNITISDLIALYKVCPTITDISINFSFDTKFDIVRNTLEATTYPYQEMFKNFLNVHFVGNHGNMLFTQLPCVMLKKAKLKKLQYTIIECLEVYNSLPGRDILHFDNFTILFSHETCMPNGSLKKLVPFDVLDFPSYETLILTVEGKHCYATPIFEVFFSKYCNSHLHENIELHIMNSFEVDMVDNACIMLWNKSATKFDDKFFSDLWCKLKPLFPCFFDPSSNTPVASDYDFYITIPREIEQKTETRVGFKRKRIAAPNCVLNYDSVFKEKSQNIQLALSFHGKIKSAVTLSPSCNYLKKLTYLSLRGQVRYSVDFFNVLFRCCNNLTTLLVKSNSFSSCSAAIARSLPLSQSLKNIHLIDKGIDFPTLYSSMSQCTTLENVHILDTTYSTNFTDASVLFEKCVNLYSFNLYVHSSLSAKRKFLQIFKKASRNQSINVNILLSNHKYVILFPPYTDVFRLNLL
ncbi:uncharacterized protein LOC123872779 [Maniola jurtina]|uniref:uncharacterized protein LOC123872779 n=1 Tax=Maniola jurtina TaxID=191418 RepID=UPI001E68A588|nr:uncharacterized protein LOC123872779 [Maniola jurtina]